MLEVMDNLDLDCAGTIINIVSVIYCKRIITCISTPSCISIKVLCISICLHVFGDSQYVFLAALMYFNSFQYKVCCISAKLSCISR